MKTKHIFISVALVCLIFLISGIPPTEKFTIVVLPDTQYYVDHDNHEPLPWNPPYYYCNQIEDIYLHQTQWIADHKVEYNIQFVAHMGDITNGSNSVMFMEARVAHLVLHQAGIPFNVVLGNHDYDGDLFLRNTENYTSSFGNFTPAWYDGHMGDGIDNTYQTFSSNGFNFLVISLEYAPRKDAICWADNVIASHQNHRVIINTHCYMDLGGNRCNCTDVPVANEPPVIGSDGWNLWDELIQRHSNIFMVLSGHKNDSEYRQRFGLAGNVIHEILTDYQYEYPLGENIRCGNGWLRLLEFDPAENKINIRSISVEEGNASIFSGGDPMFYENEYDMDPYSVDHQYSIDYDMTSPMPTYVHTTSNAHFNDLTVNNNQSGDQKYPSIGMDEMGNFVVVWWNSTNNSISMRGFYAGGCPRWDEQQVNTIVSGSVNDPEISMAPNGNFVVVWKDETNGNDIYMKGFNPNGTQRFIQERVNNATAHHQGLPSVAMSVNGNFVVVWEDDSNNGNGSYDIWGRGFLANGDENTQIGTFTVNSNTDDHQFAPEIAMDGYGNFAVVWADEAGSQDFDIEYRCFNANGVPLSSDALVNGPITSDEHVGPSIAMTTSGEFIVTWQYDSNDNNIWGVWARRFGSNGNPIGDMFPLNPTSSSDQRNAKVSINSWGDFIIVWADEGSEVNGYYEIYGSKYSPTGVLLYGPFSMNIEGAGQQMDPDIVLNNNGTFVTVWVDDMDKNEYTEILARGIKMSELVVESNGGGTVMQDSQNAPSGSMIDIHAYPNSGKKLSHWTGGAEDPSAAETYVFMDGDHTVTAFFVDENIGIEDTPSPQNILLYQNIPNPFNSSTEIQYNVPVGGGNVVIRIYDAVGNIVTTLVDAPQLPGLKSITWNGINDAGSRVGSGIYFCTMSTPRTTSKVKMVVLQ